MIKVIPSGSYEWDSPVAQLIDVHSRGIDKAWMTKRAAVLTDEIKSIRPEAGYSFIHLIDMGAQEAYGPNRNGDGFNEKRGTFELAHPKPGMPKTIEMGGGLIEYHPTFMKFAHVYKHHQNKDPKKAIGEVKAAAYNHEMRRGELIIKVANEHPDWHDDIEKLSNGKDIPFSMACKVAYDICSGCGNKAKTRAEYCSHLSDQMSEIIKSGHQYFAINDQPGFFDISKVFKPADRIAWSLQKVAGFDGIGGAALAEQLGVTEPDFLENFAVSPLVLPYKLAQKMAAAKKLAEIEKHIEASAQAGSNQHLKDQAACCPTEDMDDASMSKLKGCNLCGALTALNDAKICLSVKDFFKLVMGSKYDSSVENELPGVEKALPGIFNRSDAKELAGDSTYDNEDHHLPREVRNLIESLVSGHSMSPEASTKRLRVTIIRGAKPSLKDFDEKSASVTKAAEALAKEYAKYLLSSLTKQSSDFCNVLTILRNFITVRG